MAGRRDADGLAYVRERAASEPGRGIFVALEGVFQARQADKVSLFRRLAWVNDAVAKLDRAVAVEPGLPRYLRGIVLAGLPERFGKARTAVEDLMWMRGAYYGLAQAYTTLGREARAREALARSGASRLDATQRVFTADFSVSAQDGFRFRPPRLVEFVRGVHVAGLRFRRYRLRLDGRRHRRHRRRDDGSDRARGTAGAAPRDVTADQLLILTHAHWDHIGGLGAMLESNPQLIAQAAFADELLGAWQAGTGMLYGASPSGYHGSWDRRSERNRQG